MKIQQLQYFDKAWKISMHSDGLDRMHCQLVLAFGEPSLIRETSVFNHLERSYPEACIILSSTDDHMLFGNYVMVTAIEFDNTSVLCAETSLQDHKNNVEAGKLLVQQLNPQEHTTIYILADGQGINGRELVSGFDKVQAKTRFIKRLAGLNTFPGDGAVVAVVFKGKEHDLFQMEQYLHNVPTDIVNE
jgi:hypothetical protein